MGTSTLQEQGRESNLRARLEMANDVRSKRSKLRASIECGDVPLQETIAQPEWWMRRAELGRVLLWVPGMGGVTAGALLRSLDLDPRRSLGSLTVKDRLALIRELDELVVAS